MEVSEIGILAGTQGRWEEVTAVEPTSLIAALGFVVGGLLLGFVFEKIVLRKLRDRLSDTRRNWGGVVAGSLRGVVTLWFGIAGAYLALANLSLESAVADFLEDLLLVTLILSGALVAARIAGGLADTYAREEGLPSMSLFATIARMTVLALGVLIVLQSLGIAVSPLLAGLGLGGLALALALQDPLSNLISGFLMGVSGTVHAGDFVSVNGVNQGYIQDINWRNTTIRNLDNDLVIVPNTTMVAATTTNHYRPTKQRRLLVPLRVVPDSDLSRVEEVTLEVAREVMTGVEGGVPGFEPFLISGAFGAFGVEFSVIMRVQEFLDGGPVQYEFIKRLDERYRREGIEVPFSTVAAVLADGSKPGGNTGAGSAGARHGQGP